MIMVRPEEVGDQQGIETVRAAATATLRQTYRPSQKAIANRARASGSFKRLVAVADSRVVGTVQYYIESQAVRIIGLGVRTDYRKKGVARAIIHHLRNIGIKEKASHVLLHTIKETGNVEVFTRLGFTVVSEQKDELMESDIFENLTEVKLIIYLPEGNGVKAAEPMHAPDRQ
ncbi:MAG: Acetyltransferase (GNAT) family protein [Syntrophorhabdus sp. PtaB.Bin006]|nr:MAG: Acetyltransferase (GNAT) family protein [Syntrophorhabdus sp. PtaB.Bin006]